MAVHILISAGVGALWVLSLLVKPFGRCFLCLGRRVFGAGRLCPACKGAGRRQRLGSKLVHRLRRLAVAGWRGRREEG